MRRVRREIWALLAVQFLFASNAVVGRLNVQQLGPRLLVLLRIVGAAGIFLALARRYGVQLPRARRDLALLCACGILGVSLNQTLFLAGLYYSTATHSTIIGTTIPVFAAAIAAAFGLERLTLAKCVGIALALAGALFLSGAPAFGLRPPAGEAVRLLARVEDFHLGRATLGDLCFVANSLSYAGYLVLSRRLVQRYGAPTQIVWTFALGALTILPFGLPGLAVLGSGARLPRWLWLTVPYTIVFPTVFAYYLNAFALREVESSTAATWIYLQPLLTVALAIPILGERPSPRTGVAALLIFAGVLLCCCSATLPHELFSESAP
ncbi:MAG: DMT family transporter [Myxococcales bacterium]